MTKAELKKRLNSGRISKQERDSLITAVLDYPALVSTLLEEVIIEDKNDTFNASWVLDNALRKDLRPLLPCLNTFCNMLPSLQSESVMRPMAHICEMLVLCYFKNKNPDCSNSIRESHLEKMTEVCFDWLIGSHKIACKVFAMTSLFYLGEQFKWVRPELKMVLENTIANSSTGYQNRAMKTIAMLNAQDI